MSNVYDPGNGQFVVVDGQIVEKDALRIAERVKEYDENLEIMCLDPALSGLNDAPFVLCERKPNGTLVRVFEFWELNATILERIYLADQQRFNGLDRLVTMEELQKKEREDRYKEKMAANLDILKFGMLNKKHNFTIPNSEGELVRISDNKPSEPAKKRSVTHGPSSSN